MGLRDVDNFHRSSSTVLQHLASMPDDCFYCELHGQGAWSHAMSVLVVLRRVDDDRMTLLDTPHHHTFKATIRTLTENGLPLLWLTLSVLTKNPRHKHYLLPRPLSPLQLYAVRWMRGKSLIHRRIRADDENHTRCTRGRVTERRCEHSA